MNDFIKVGFIYISVASEMSYNLSSGSLLLSKGVKYDTNGMFSEYGW